VLAQLCNPVCLVPRLHRGSRPTVILQPFISGSILQAATQAATQLDLVYGTVPMLASSQRILIVLVAKLFLWPDIRLLLFKTEYLTTVGYSNIRIFIHSPTHNHLTCKHINNYTYNTRLKCEAYSTQMVRLYFFYVPVVIKEPWLVKRYIFSITLISQSIFYRFLFQNDLVCMIMRHLL